MRREDAYCAVCGAELYGKGGALCECCRESFALCDMDDYLLRRSVGGICGGMPSNAFKSPQFMVKYPKSMGSGGA